MSYHKPSFRNSLKRFDFNRVSLLDRYKGLSDSLATARALSLIIVFKVQSMSCKVQDLR